MDFHPAFRAEITAEANRLRGKYTAPLHLSVENPPVWDDPRTADAMAWTENTAGRGFPVQFNAQKFGLSANPAATLRALADSRRHRFSVVGTPDGVLTHEYGHVLADHLSRADQSQFALDLREYLRRNATTERHLYAALSEYGVSDPWEAMAEAFVLFDRGADHPAARIAAKYLRKFQR